jgi:hypothetical protein
MRRVKIIIFGGLVIFFILSSFIVGFLMGRINYRLEYDIGTKEVEFGSWVILESNETVNIKNESISNAVEEKYWPVIFFDLNPNKMYLLVYNIITTTLLSDEDHILSMSWVFTNETEYKLRFHLNKACIILSQLTENDSELCIYIIFYKYIKWEVAFANVVYDFDLPIYLYGVLTSLVVGFFYGLFYKNIVPVFRGKKNG